MRAKYRQKSPLRRAWQLFRARSRLIGSLTLGGLLFSFLPQQWPMSTRALVTWDASAGLYLVLAWLLIARASVTRTRWGAQIQHDGAAAVLFLTVAAAVASLAAIIIELSGLKNLPPVEQDLHIALVACTLIVSWLLVHTAFALHYASDYYASLSLERAYALEFPRQQAPVYMDFLYFSLVVGMTSQTSDVAITTTPMRRLVMTHAMISFLFNTTLLALAVNIAASILD